MGLFFKSIITMLGKTPSVPFQPLDRTPSNQSYNATLKHYHNEIHTILSEAITADEKGRCCA